MFYFHTSIWGNDPIWLYNIFQDGMVQPPSSLRPEDTCHGSIPLLESAFQHEHFARMPASSVKTESHWLFLGHKNLKLNKLKAWYFFWNSSPKLPQVTGSNRQFPEISFYIPYFLHILWPREQVYATVIQDRVVTHEVYITTTTRPCQPTVELHRSEVGNGDLPWWKCLK